jgi:hypothetical protein
MSDEDQEGTPPGDDDPAGPILVAGDNPPPADGYLLLVPLGDVPERLLPPSGVPVPAGEDPASPPPEDPESRPESELSRFA